MHNLFSALCIIELPFLPVDRDLACGDVLALANAIELGIIDAELSPYVAARAQAAAA